MLRTHRAEKGPGGMGVGLRLNTAGGFQECLRPWRAEDQVQDPRRLPGPEGVWETLGAFPQSSNPGGSFPAGLSSSLPTMTLGPTWPEGALEAQQTSQAHVGRGNARHASPDPPILEGSPPTIHLSSSSPLHPSSYAPRTHTAGGSPGEPRTRPGKPAGFPGPDWAGEMLGTLPLIL